VAVFGFNFVALRSVFAEGVPLLIGCLAPRFRVKPTVVPPSFWFWKSTRRKKSIAEIWILRRRTAMWLTDLEWSRHPLKTYGMPT
jgi:hypothetical protein